MIQTLSKLYHLISFQEKKKTLILFFMILIVALLDMIGVASIMPFMLVLADPTIIDKNEIFSLVYKWFNIFGVTNSTEFLIIIGILNFLLFALSITAKAFTVFLQIRYIHICEYNLSKNLLKNYLQNTYSWFVTKNSANLVTTVLSEVNTIIQKGLGPIIDIISKGTAAAAMIFLLLFIDLKITLIVLFSVGGIYIVIYLFINRFLEEIGKKRLQSNKERFVIVGEAFGGFREVKIGYLERFFVNLFSKSAIVYANTNSSALTISALPRFILELIFFGGALLLILFLMLKTENLNQVIPILSLYAFAAYRLIPTIQHIYASVIKINFVGTAINNIFEDLKKSKSYKNNKNKNFTNLDLKKEIVLNNISYTYPNTSKKILKNISLRIPSKSKIGLIGSTGSGKTTIVDIISGLLKVQEGSLEVNGQKITDKNLIDWQQNIGYVPQKIYLSDDTIASNIAFGVDKENINHETIEKVSKVAGIHDFIINELPEKYQTIVGERGVRLSGGQCQRIGIARSLYSDPKLLILDEATNALDSNTEQQVIESINQFSENITVIIIAHRLNTLKNCNYIYKIERNQIIKQLTYDQLT